MPPRSSYFPPHSAEKRKRMWWIKKKNRKRWISRAQAIEMRSLRCDVVGVWLFKEKKNLENIFDTSNNMPRKIDIKIKRRWTYHHWLNSLHATVKLKSFPRQHRIFRQLSFFFFAPHSCSERKMNSCSLKAGTLYSGDGERYGSLCVDIFNRYFDLWI